MPIHVALRHRTTYTYEKPVSLGPQVIRLRPAPHARTPVLSYSLNISPKNHFLNWQQDPQGNFQARVVFPEKVSHFDVTVDLIADMATQNPFDFFLEPDAETWPFAYDPLLDEELAPFRKAAPAGPLLNGFLAAVPRHERRTIDMLVGLNQSVLDRTAYIVRMEPGVWSPEQTLSEGRGSCRDSAWLLVQALRHLGLAARFVSGYLIQLVGDIKPVTGPEGPTSDFTDLHAWAEVYLPGAGWVGLDATSGLLTGEGHIPLAATPEPASAAPISGMVEPAETTFGFEMGVTRVLETPRVTKPYSAAQWQRIQATGRAVDAALTQADVRLTMGGEPTFVADSDRDAAEWNTDAQGPTKRAFAGRLLRRLAPLWAPGAALQYAQGKQYPGEALPRFGLHCHWRADGVPVWEHPELLAADEDRDTATPADAERFARILAERLQVDPGLVQSGYEDTHYYLWKESRLPANVLFEDSKLADPLERARLARLYRQGLTVPVGSMLPLRRVVEDGSRRWQSGHWYFRDGIMFLVPGDSPMGLRLPLTSLPWIEPAELALHAQAEPDPFAERSPLPDAATLDARRGPTLPPIGEVVARRQMSLRRAMEELHTGLGIENYRPRPQAVPDIDAQPKEDAGPVRTALCVESRGGLIHVFLPPVFAAEDWLDLVAAIEGTALETGRKIFLEGYLPPEDPRLPSFSVTPDPGVIEVNIHPMNDWGDVTTRTAQLYEEARQVGLTAEKFMMDGRHVGTGGGNHVVMGAADAADSPFLRRPDLLRSLVSFWHNHPSLSYLFSGLFIGPTSQHPRMDEARQDNVRELELAFTELARATETPPWLTDRLFRNILADMTGNTHRTEFCIDKMYNPDSSSGRRGLVEFRGFEMPPHAEMSAAQMLLMRATVAAFWHHPYERRLIRWGTRLHDNFMLPELIGRDFRDALEDLGSHGFRLDPAWFAPHMEFRFPLIGETTLRDMHLEVRHALEPWHVLGEEQAAGGTARYVDSSAERIQVKLGNFSPERYSLACNGIAVPLTPTENTGEYFAGIRFKAWSPYSALHPTIKAQTPLTIDIHDSWNQRSLGGITHHTVHPGGRSYETFPVNANEAEARRRARFLTINHSPGTTTPRPSSRSPEHPLTLDLRAYA